MHACSNSDFTTTCRGGGYQCTEAEGIVRWLALFFQLVLLGLPFIFLGSLGNSIYYQKDKIRNFAFLVIATATIAMFTVVPFCVVRRKRIKKGEGRRESTYIYSCNSYQRK